MPVQPSPPTPIRYSQEQLREALTQAFSGGEFAPNTFFPEWFRRRGRAHTFVFKKNLKVTNIQLAELFALLRAHSTYVDDWLPMGVVNREIYPG